MTYSPTTLPGFGGGRIYFTSDRYWGIDDVWVMDVDGGNPLNLTEDDRTDVFGP